MKISQNNRIMASLLGIYLLVLGQAVFAETVDGVTISEIEDVTFWSFQDQGLNVGGYDPVLFVEPQGPYHYMYVGDGGERDTLIPDNGVKGQDLYRSEDLKTWTKVADDVKDQHGNIISTTLGTNFNWGRKVGGTYYLYQSRSDTAMHLYTGKDLSKLTYRGQVLDESDAGGFYDEATQTWHMYYESGNISGPSGDALGHATSKDGIHWTKSNKFALNLGPSGANTGWKTGDPDIIKVNDTYHMFIDNTINHPDYRIAWATSTDLTNWELKEHAITHWPGGDAVVRYLPETNEFMMYQEFRGKGGGRKGIGYAIAPANGFGTSQAEDPENVAGLRMWLKDAGTDFVAGDGETDAVWKDSSGNSNHMRTLAGVATADPTKIEVINQATGHRFRAVQFAGSESGHVELMKSSDLRGAGDVAASKNYFTDLTLFIVYRLHAQDGDGNTSNIRPAGIGSMRDGSSVNNFNLASDGSIRKDNGFIKENDETLPVDEFFIRISRMTNNGDNADDIDEWLHVAGDELDLFQTRGRPFTTSSDDFYLGDLRDDKTGLTGDRFEIAEVLVFDRALDDSQIIGIDTYLSQKYLVVPEPSSLMLLGPAGICWASRSLHKCY